MVSTNVNETCAGPVCGPGTFLFPFKSFHVKVKVLDSAVAHLLIISLCH